MLQEALPGLIWDLGQQLGDLSLESGGLDQESGRSSGEGMGSLWDTPVFLSIFYLCSPSLPDPPLPLPTLASSKLSVSSWNPGFYEDPSSTGGPDSPPSTFCGDSGFSGSGSYGRLGPSDPRGIYASERPKSLGTVGGWDGWGPVAVRK